MPTDPSELLSPRAAAALLDAGYDSIEAAQLETDEALLALSGFGATSLRILRERVPDNEPPPGGESFEAAVEDAREARGVAFRSGIIPPLPLSKPYLAERILGLMADKAATLTPRMVQLAWELADVFEGAHEARLVDPAGTVLAEGLHVRYQGTTYAVRTHLRAGEELPEDAVRIALVPA